MLDKPKMATSTKNLLIWRPHRSSVVSSSVLCRHRPLSLTGSVDINFAKIAQIQRLHSTCFCIINQNGRSFQDQARDEERSGVSAGIARDHEDSRWSLNDSLRTSQSRSTSWNNTIAFAAYCGRYRALRAYIQQRIFYDISERGTTLRNRQIPGVQIAKCTAMKIYEKIIQ